MDNIRQRAEVNKESAYELWWQAYSRVAGAGAVLVAMRETFEEEGLELTLDASQKTAHEALANLGAWAAFDSLDLLQDLFNVAELWERRAKEAGYKERPEEVESEQGRAEDESFNRKEVENAIIRLVLLDSTPDRAIETTYKALKVCIKGENDEAARLARESKQAESDK